MEKKGGGEGNSNFPTGIEPLTFSGFDLVVWEREMRKKRHCFDFRSWIGISFFSLKILTLAALFLIYWG